MVWIGIGTSLTALSTVRGESASVYIQLKGKRTSDDDTVLSGLMPDGSRLALIGKIA